MDFKPGEQVTWIWTVRDDYRYRVSVEATVIEATSSQATIEVGRKTGHTWTKELRVVKPKSLRKV